LSARQARDADIADTAIDAGLPALAVSIGAAATIGDATSIGRAVLRIGDAVGVALAGRLERAHTVGTTITVTELSDAVCGYLTRALGVTHRIGRA